jgi:hypothetical protein
VVVDISEFVLWVTAICSSNHSSQRENHAFAKSIKSMVGDVYTTCSSEGHINALLAMAVRDRPVQMLDLVAGLYAVAIVMSGAYMGSMNMSFALQMDLIGAKRGSIPAVMQTNIASRVELGPESGSTPRPSNMAMPKACLPFGGDSAQDRPLIHLWMVCLTCGDG